MPRLGGILPALITPMDEKGAIAWDILEGMVEWLLDGNVQGLYACGTSGEGMLLTTTERMEVAQRVVSQVGRRGAVIVHVGAVSTEESIQLARHAQTIGAAAVSSVPPFAYGRSPAGMKLHYEKLAEATELPLYLYNIPSVTGVEMTATLVRPLLDLPTVQGLKFSDYNLFAEFELIQLREDFDVFHGSDETLLYALMMGAAGGIGLIYNFMPARFVELFSLVQKGETEKANQLQLRISRFIALFLTHSGDSPVAFAKRFMEWLGHACGPARAPNPPVSPTGVDGFRRALAAAGLEDLLPITSR